MLCPSCQENLPRTHYHRQSGNAMESRFAGLFPFERATGHFFYSPGSDLSEIIHDLKYRHFRKLARYMGALTAKELLMTGYFSDIDLLLPIPVHFIKKAIRGYNQTEEISEGISSVTSIPVSRMLKSSRPHGSQTRLSLQERNRNLKNVFYVKNPGELENRHILLVDDVCTTGATLRHAAEEIVRCVDSVKVSILTIGVTF